MQQIENIYNYNTLLPIIFVLLLSFIAGFIDSIVGGGGLIQMPGLLIAFPLEPLPKIFGTNKIAAFFGTIVSTIQYSKRIIFNYKLLLWMLFFASIFSYLGSKTISYFSPNKLKPIILIILIIVLIYSIFKKDIYNKKNKNISLRKQIIYGSILCSLVGFYDGFFGPGTGSFLILGIIFFLGFDYIQASAYSKLINCFTNISALCVFVFNNNYIGKIAFLMAIMNIFGNFLGSRLVLKNGNNFVRGLFIFISTILIIRYVYDIFFK